MADKRADDTFAFAAMVLLAIGGLMIVTAWINNELPTWLMQAIATVFHASRTGGR